MSNKAKQKMLYSDVLKIQMQQHVLKTVARTQGESIEMSLAPPPVTNSGEDVIHRAINVPREALAEDSYGSLEEAYEVAMTVKTILSGGYERVALQFPDELLHDSVAVFRAVRAKLLPSTELYVLADTTYGSCCVDEVAAQHVEADLIVHYGHTCLSPTSRLPVIYVLTKRPINTIQAAESLASTSRLSMVDNEEDHRCKAVVLMYDVAYAHKADEIWDRLKKELRIPVVLAKLDRLVHIRKGKGRETEPESHFVREGKPESTAAFDAKVSDPSAPLLEGSRGYDTFAHERSTFSSSPPPRKEDERSPSSVPFHTGGFHRQLKVDLPDGLTIDDCAIFYLGGESLNLNNLLITHGNIPVWAFDPKTETTRLESNKTNRMLMRRYASVEKAKDADVFGILVGTLGVAAYLPLITHLRQLIARHHKKAYTVAVGKLNPAKLANFMEVECYVLVACPENTLIDSKEFLRPIITPFELELALTGKAWTGRYILNFEELLNETTFGQDLVGPNISDDDEEGPRFSSVTGKYRHPKRYNISNGATGSNDLDTQMNALSIRDTSSTVARLLGSAAGEHLSTRTYKGLEPRYGMDLPAIVTEGRSGIAKGYGDEK